jgi:uncharacterized protein (DUF58 family)
MNGDTSTLTLRGRVVLGSAAGMALAAWLVGLQELYCTAVAAVVLVVGSRLWVDLRRWDISVTRLVHPGRVAAGQEARVELAARNTGRRPSPPVEAQDPFDGGVRWARFAIAPLRPGEVRSSSYRLPSARRGIYRLGPLELCLVDPLGLARRRRVTAADTSLTVHPAWQVLPVGGLSSHRDDERRSPRPVLGKGGSDFFMLREYVPGDDLRHVHWPTTARVDDLVIRQPETLRRGRVTVVADLRAPVVDEETLEAVLSAAAGIAMSSLRAALQVRLVTTAGWDSGHGTGGDHGPALLDGLAAATRHRPRHEGDPFRLAGDREPVVVVTTDRASEADLESAFAAGGGASTVVLFETAGGGGRRLRGPEAGARSSGGGRRGSGPRSVFVARGVSFATAWAAGAAVAVGP